MGIVLVLGGTKTGKTTFAERRAADIAEKKKIPVHYIATARAIDGEMERRIEKHRSSRPAEWITVEEPLEVAKIAGELAQKDTVLILDCLTMLMTNLIFDRGENCTREEAEDVVFAELERIIGNMRERDRELIIISNQVENGLVSEYAWARMFQDIAGMAHQKLAAAADHVFMLNAGIALQLK